MVTIVQTHPGPLLFTGARFVTDSRTQLKFPRNSEIVRLHSRSFNATLLFLFVIFLLPHRGTGQTAKVSSALHSAFSGTPSVAVVLDGNDGRLLAAQHPQEVDTVSDTPGSALKPLFLMAALQQGLIRENDTVLCSRSLHIAGHNLSCMHPPDPDVFNGETALAYSCNTYFASLATRFTPKQAVAVLREDGFGTQSTHRPEGSAGSVVTPVTMQNLQLLVLGLKGVTVTPLQLARAYWRLSQQLNSEPAVQRGLQGSVDYGAAHNAATQNVETAGKTGTANNPGQPWSHGWFAGIASYGKASIIIVVYLPHGNGGDAALLAHRFFAQWQGSNP
jgi:cell division protein FtsI/penicillin-binding protein 2